MQDTTIRSPSITGALGTNGVMMVQVSDALSNNEH